MFREKEKPQTPKVLAKGFKSKWKQFLKSKVPAGDLGHEINILTVFYLIGSVTFILGLKMSNPDSARKGNLIAASGMTIAILGTIFLYKDEEGKSLHNYAWIFAGIVIGAVVGTLAAKKVKMTAMPRNGELVQWYGWRMCSIDFYRWVQSPGKRVWNRKPCNALRSW